MPKPLARALSLPAAAVLALALTAAPLAFAFGGMPARTLRSPWRVHFRGMVLLVFRDIYATAYKYVSNICKPAYNAMWHIELLGEAERDDHRCKTLISPKWRNKAAGQWTTRAACPVSHMH